MRHTSNTAPQNVFAAMMLLPALLFALVVVTPAWAFADDDPASGGWADSADSAAPVEEYSEAEIAADIAAEQDEYIEVDWANFGITLPSGGRFLTEEEAGMSEVADLMEYPVIWVSDGATDYAMLMLGVYTNLVDFNELTFTSTLNDYHSTLAIDLPEIVEDSTDVVIGDYTWNRVVLANSANGTRASVYSIYVGALFYTLAFASPLDLDATLERSAQEATLANFGVLELPEDAGDYGDDDY